METEACEVLYRFFRTASEYIEGYRSDAPYPESFVFAGDSTALVATTSAAVNAVSVETGSAEIVGTVTGTSTAISAGNGGTLFRSMQEIYAAVAQCSACVLGQTRTHPVAGEGPEELSRLTNSVEVMVIGEGPGADEDRQGRPFVGRGGRFFDYQGIPLMPTYHPSALLRDESLKRPAWEDLKRFRARLHELQAQG